MIQIWGGSGFTVAKCYSVLITTLHLDYLAITIFIIIIIIISNSITFTPFSMFIFVNSFIYLANNCTRIKSLVYYVNCHDGVYLDVNELLKGIKRSYIPKIKLRKRKEIVQVKREKEAIRYLRV